jgi:hypothetical protein
MTQAGSITTAIRELMSRGQPLKSTNLVRAAHTKFIAALAGNAPRPIHSETDWQALERRGDHLQKVFAALHFYVMAIIAEIAEKIIEITLDRHYANDGNHRSFISDKGSQERFAVFRSGRRRRTPGPSSLSAIKRTPALSSASRIRARASSDTFGPVPVSIRFTVGSDIPARSASCVWDHPRSPRAARICSRVTALLSP